MSTKKSDHFQALELGQPNRRRRAANQRRTAQRRLDLKAANALFDGVEGGLNKAMLDRLQAAVLRTHCPLTLEELAAAVRVLGNKRVDRFRLLERRVGTVRATKLFMQAPSRAQMRGKLAQYARRFELSRGLARGLGEKLADERGSCRQFFVEIAAMRPNPREPGLLEIKDQNLENSPVLRLSLLRGDNRLLFALVRTSLNGRSRAATEAQALALAESCAGDNHPQGLFACVPHDSQACDEGGTIEPTLRAVDPVQAVAQFLVYAARAFRRGSPVVVTLADATGAIDPVLLKQAVLRHHLRVPLHFAYLPAVG